jgi:hypothetical protein
MSEAVQVAAKAPLANKEAQSQKGQKPELMQSRDSPIEKILFLQRTIGNQAVERLIRSGAFQTKFRIGHPADEYEQEADQVMRIPEHEVRQQFESEEEETLQTKPSANQITPLVQVQRQEELENEVETLQTKLHAEQITSLVQRQVEEEEKEEEILQPKLTVGEPNDVYEQEADTLAKTVMGMLDQSSIQDEREDEQDDDIAQTKSGSESNIQPKNIQHADEETKGIFLPDPKDHIHTKRQTQGSVNTSFHLARTIQSTHVGSPMPQHIQKRIERHLGKSLKHVRVHNDKNAHNAAQSIQAKAFTHQNHIYLGQEQSLDDVRLLTHESVHVLQQGSSSESIGSTSLQQVGEFPQIQRENTFDRLANTTTSNELSTPVETSSSIEEMQHGNESESVTDVSNEEPEGQSVPESETINSDVEEGETDEAGAELVAGDRERGEETETSRGFIEEQAEITEQNPEEGGELTPPQSSVDLALIDFELAEHERWAGSFGEMGTAGSDQRAQFLLDQAGQGAVSGAVGGAGTAFVMGAIGAGVGQIAGRRLATLAVSRSSSAIPVPGLGPAIGGVMAVSGLVTRVLDWSTTADTIGRMGTGEGYQGLANDLEGIAEILDLATQIMDVLAGVLGGIAVGMWIGAVLSAGALSPLAASLSAIALGINLATTAVGVIINIVIRPTVTALRALHSFESQGDPDQIEAEGRQLQAAAGQITGAVAGAAAGRLGGAAGTGGGARADRAVTRWQGSRRGGTPAMSAEAGPGPRIHVEVPEAPTRVEAGGTAPSRPAAVDGGSAYAFRPASTEGPVARSSSPERPRSGGSRPQETRVHDRALREARDRVESRLGRELTPDEIRSLDIMLTIEETTSQTRAMSERGGRIGPEFHDLPSSVAPAPQRRRGDDPAGRTQYADRGAKRRIQGHARRVSRHEFGRNLQTALRDPSQHSSLTLKTLGYLTPRERLHVERTGELPPGFEFHHLMGVADYPEHAHRPDVGLGMRSSEHYDVGHARDQTAEIEAGTFRDPDAEIRPGFGEDREFQRYARPRHRNVESGYETTGSVVRDIRIQYERSLNRNRVTLAQLQKQAQLNPSPALDRRIGRLIREIDGSVRLLQMDLEVTGSTTSGPAASSPERTSVTSSAASSSYRSNTETVRNSDRTAAMAQYHNQIRTDPGRESGVWRDADGNYYVMQGDRGSVAPPSAAGPLELIYHSHPTETGTARQGLVSQPSQAAGDIGVLQYQHGQGTPGRRQSSELHFPVYDRAGVHTGYGTTRFGYDPTHPLPLQVQTTLPGGRPGTQRYASFADYEARTGIRAGGTTPADSTTARVAADTQLGRDTAAAQQRIDTIVEATRTEPVGMPGVREGRQLGRQMIIDEAQAEDSSNRPEHGPAYTASVGGIQPGESIEIPINPAYPEPPGTRAELDLLLERVSATQEAQTDLEGTERSMANQAEQQRTHSTQLGEAQTVTRDLATGRSNHQAAVDSTQSTNTQQQSTAGEAISSLGRSAEEGTALVTLVGSLRVFQGLSHLFSYLPGDLGRRAEGAREDASGLITTLNRVSETESMQSRVEEGRRGMGSDAERIGSVSAEGQQTDGELTSGQDQIVELQQANSESLLETESVYQQANQERNEAVTSENEAQTAHDDLQNQLQAWAQAHRQAREAAIQDAVSRYSELGYQVREEQ